jgi:DNA polymerase-1
VRKAFVARNEEYVLMSADYSQIELRIIAAISEDVQMIDAFRGGLDIHAATAAKVYGVELSEVTPDMRRNAKSVNFGIIYGVSAFGLSENLGIARSEAKTLIDNYFTQYPSIKQYMDNQIKSAQLNGYVETLLGRKRWLKDINSSNAVVRGYAERNAINMPIQGTAADMIKLAMIAIHKKLKQENLRSRMILQVHDELVFDVHKDEIEFIKPLIEDGMRNALPLTVPVDVEIGIGRNWLEAH